jgi:uncharacterized repeat protein (TIGR03803 family)
MQQIRSGEAQRTSIGRRFEPSKLFAILCTAWLCLGSPAHAQTLTTMYSFCVTGCMNGSSNNPGGLVQGTDGELYGATNGGGTDGSGTVFKISLDGTFTTLYNFCANNECPGGISPYPGLALAANGNFYGVTEGGAPQRDGTVFRITPTGTLTTLHGFYCDNSQCPTGAIPVAGLVQATNGDLYGTTLAGGTSSDGTVFKIALNGELTSLHSFTGHADGSHPEATLVQAANGALYGTTFSQGSSHGAGAGTIFKLTPSGSLTTLLTLSTSDVGQTQAALIQASNGALYGTSRGAGSDKGTIFKITPSGTFTIMYEFTGPDGSGPSGSLVQATDGDLYGTTGGGGANGYGTIFKVTLLGRLTTLYEFTDSDGHNVYNGLVQATDGNFYGVTQNGGAAGDGTVFQFSVGLGPFVKTLPASGMIGRDVIILGTNLTGATGVTFNGTAANFTVVSASEIATTVPADATTGTVEVTTPSGTLSSNVVFSVTQ